MIKSPKRTGLCIFLIPNLYAFCSKYVTLVQMIWTWKGHHDTPSSEQGSRGVLRHSEPGGLQSRADRAAAPGQGRRSFGPVEDLALLEQLEDQIDIEEAKRILADPDEVPIPYSRVRKELQLK